MKEFDFGRLMGAMQMLAHVRQMLLMKDVVATAGTSLLPKSPVILAMDSIFSRDRVRRARETEARGREALRLHNSTLKETVAASLPMIVSDLKDLGLIFTLAAAQRLKDKFEKGEELPSQEEIGDLQTRLLDEVRERRFLGLEREFGKLYSSEQFPPDVRKKFPSATFDIDEAANCLALERGTAAVFHLMRVMEIAVRATAACLGVPDPTRPAEKNWGEMFRQIKDAMNNKWPNAASRMTGDGQFFESLMASLEAVKNPWRNATMHVENTYSITEADRIRHAVEGLMIHMAARFDERGQPKA